MLWRELSTGVAPPPAKKAKVRYDERNDEVESALHPRHRGRIACEDDVELVDRRKDDADDERDARGAAKVGPPPAIRERLPYQLAPAGAHAD